MRRKDVFLGSIAICGVLTLVACRGEEEGPTLSPVPRSFAPTITPTLTATPESRVVLASSETPVVPVTEIVPSTPSATPALRRATPLLSTPTPQGEIFRVRPTVGVPVQLPGK